MPAYSLRHRLFMGFGLFVCFVCVGFLLQPFERAQAFHSASHQNKTQKLPADFWQPLRTDTDATRTPFQATEFLASPAQQTAELRLDDGTIDGGALQDGLIILNRITPSSYPATLQRLRILFPSFNGQPDPSGKAITILIGTDGAGGGSVPALGQFTQINTTVPGTSLTNFFDITIPNGPTIAGGDFYIGYRVATPHQGVGFALDTNNSNTQAQNRTYISLDGGSSFGVLPPPSGGISAIAMMRAVVTLANVTSAPTIDVTPASLDFGTILLNSSQDRPLTIRNTGAATLNVTGASSSNPRYTVLNTTFPLAISAGAQQVISVRFNPTVQQTESGTITINSNDPARGTITVPVTGAGAQPGSTVIPLTSGTSQTGQIVGTGQSGNCALGVTQYSIAVPAGSASLQITLSSTQDLDLYARYGSAVGLQSSQVVADFRANSLSGNEIITITPTTTPALQAGTYYIAISNCSVLNANFTLAATVSTSTTGQITEELSVDDGSPESGSIVNGAFYANRLTPSRYPSRLQRIRIYFALFQGQPDPSNQQIRLIAFNNPTNNPLPASPAYFIDRPVTVPSITGTTSRYVDYEINETAQITEGDWVVGFQLSNPANGVGCVVDVSSTLQNRSFAKVSGNTAWQQLSGNFMIRAVTVSGTQPPCNYAIAPTSQNITANGGTGNINVTVASGCAWTATSNANWITINSGATGNGNGAVAFTAAANPATTTRTGTLTVAGQTFTVTQAAQPCTYSIAPTSQTVASGGGNGTVNVTSLTGCAWTATSNAAWLTINSGATGSGNGSVTFTAAANPNPATRTGTLTVAGQTFTVTQEAVACTYSIAPTSQSVASGGGNGTVNVTSLTGCAWTATSNAAWLTINSGATGNGNGTVGFTAAANPNPATRTGTLTVAGQTFTVTQEAVACTYSIAPTSQTVASGGGNGTVNVTSLTGCAWTATSNAAWLTINSGATGNGNGTVTFTAAANPNPATRTGTLTVAGQTFTVTQEAVACTYSIAPTSQSFEASGGNGTVNVTSIAGCAWTATSNAAWLSITAGATGTGNGTVSFIAAANPSTETRTGTLTIGGQTFTVTQTGIVCTYTISPTSESVGANGGNGSVAVTSSNTICAWTAISNANWLTINAGASGTGNGTVSYQAAANNTSGSRTGTLTIAGLTFTVTQAAPCSFSLSANNASVENFGGTRSVAVTSQSGCAWSAASNVEWMRVTEGGAGSGNGNVTFTIAANTANAQRAGTLSIAGQTFTVTQAGANIVNSVSAASYLGASLATDSIVAAFGTNMATRTEIGSTIPLPTTLAGTSVRIRDSVGTERLAQLFFVSSAQINFLMPVGLSEGAGTVLVTSGDQTLSVGTVTISNVAPGLFTANADGKGVPAGLALRVKTDGSQVYEALATFDAAQGRFVPVPVDVSNANEQVFLILFGTGFRNVAKLSDVTAQLAGANAEVLYAGTQGGLAGLDQINVRLAPNLAGRGNVDFSFAIGARTANTVTIAVK